MNNNMTTTAPQLWNQVLVGDNRETLKQIPDCSIDCCVTSPPYWGLRDYGGQEKQIGLELSPEEYVSQLVTLFSEVRRALCDHGTLWLNLGDSYCPVNRGEQTRPKKETLTGISAANPHSDLPTKRSTIQWLKANGIKQKDLLGIPWMVAFALRASGWHLRQEVIWHKPAPMPSSVKDRCTTSHEQLFLLSKSPKYYYDWFAVSEPSKGNRGSSFTSEKTKHGKNRLGETNRANADRANKRSVWTINTESYSGAHFAVYPRKLVEPCILAGCPERVCEECGQPWRREVESKRVATRPGTGSKISKDQDGLTVGNRDPQRHTTTYIDKGFSPVCYCSSTSRRGRVLDPFLGSGTTAAVAQDLGRDWIGCELNPEYVPLIHERTEQGVLF